MPEELFWADQIARRVVKERGDKKLYTVAAGITPSGTIHIGNFREMITVDLIRRALESMGRKVKFIYSWDEYERFRKVPANVPKKEMLEKFIGFPITEVPDTFGCHSNYAEHMEHEVSDALPKVGIRPEFLHQSVMYRGCKYAEEIRHCLLASEKIREVLNKFRKKEDPLPETWHPLHIFCEGCKKDEAWVTAYDGKYTVNYECTCGHNGKVNFKEKGIVKLPWRVDWPMRWHYEKVDCEGGGKDHNAPGGSIDTGQEILKAVYSEQPPVSFMYDFVISKSGGKMAKSTGNLVRLVDVLEVYLPEVVRFFFAGTKPMKEFSIPMDAEVFKAYEDFYQTERIYFGKTDDQRKAHWSRVYFMSCPDGPPKSMPIQPAFKHCAELINIYREPAEAIKHVKEKLSKGDAERYLLLLACAKNWIEKYAPEEYRFELNEKVPSVELSDKQRLVLRELGSKLDGAKTEEDVVELFTTISRKHDLDTKSFFKGAYQVLISRENGPRLAPFIMAIGKEKVAKLFGQIRN